MSPAPPPYPRPVPVHGLSLRSAAVTFGMRRSCLGKAGCDVPGAGTGAGAPGVGFHGDRGQTVFTVRCGCGIRAEVASGVLGVPRRLGSRVWGLQLFGREPRAYAGACRCGGRRREARAGSGVL